VTLRITRRSSIAFAAGMASLSLVGRASAAALAMPTEKRILTVTGKIVNTNDGKAAVFDRPMLEGLGMDGFETSTPWYSGPVRFEGLLMQRLMQAVGASGTSVMAVALNDYTTDLPIADFARYGVLLAMKRDGNYVPVRDKGPLFIVYPYDSRPELKSQQFYARSAWQVAKLVVG
jgi:hypothetical protein